jgi:hypothetical protein
MIKWCNGLVYQCSRLVALEHVPVGNSSMSCPSFWAPNILLDAMFSNTLMEYSPKTQSTLALNCHKSLTSPSIYIYPTAEQETDILFNYTISCSDYIASMADEWNMCEALVDWYWYGKREIFGEKPAPVPICPPQISHELPCDQTIPLQWRPSSTLI